MARAAQQQFEVMADKKDKVLTKLAAEYVDARDRRMACGDIELEKKVALQLKMQEKGLTSYRDPDTGMIVLLEEGKISLKVVTDPKADDLEEREIKRQKDAPKTVDVKARAAGEKDEDEDDWSEPLTKRDVPQPGERKLLPPAGGTKKRKKAAA
jgi:hypothetical protein